MLACSASRSNSFGTVACDIAAAEAYHVLDDRGRGLGRIRAPLAAERRVSQSVAAARRQDSFEIDLGRPRTLCPPRAPALPTRHILRHSRGMKILVVDDHPVMLEGLSALLRQEGPQTIIVQASSATQALAAVESHQDLDIVVLDLMMPGASGLSTISEIGRARPELPVVVLSSSEDPIDVRNALSQGALGYVPKSASRTTLLSAISLVMNGELYIPPLMLNQIATARPVADRPTPRALLTPRQIDVLRCIGESLPNKTIAYEMDLSEKTVKAHITAIFKALNVVNRTQAAAAGRDLGLIRPTREADVARKPMDRP